MEHPAYRLLRQYCNRGGGWGGGGGLWFFWKAVNGGAAESGPGEGVPQINVGACTLFVGGVLFDGWEGSVVFLSVLGG